MRTHLQPFLKPVLILSLAITGASAFAQGGPAVQSRYARIDDCRVTRLYTQDVGYRETRCPAVGGFALQPSESDGRDELVVLSANGRKQALNLTGTAGSGFGTLGDTAEWRLRGARPHAVIVRFSLSEDPDRAELRTSYLVVASVSRSRSCVIGKVAPGPDQNARARRIADVGGRCLRPT